MNISSQNIQNYIFKKQDHREYLIERLRDPKKVLAYLNAALADCKDDNQESQQVLLLAFKTVAQA